MAITKTGFLELEGNIKSLWDANHKEHKLYIEPLYNMVKNNLGQYTDYTIGTAGRMANWEGQVAYDTFEEGFTKEYRARKYSTGIQIDRDMWEDGEFTRLKPYVNEVSYGVIKTLRYDGVRIFNEAFSTTLKTADGKALCAADHKTTPNASEQSNIITEELTYDGVEAAQLRMENFVDDRGDEMLIEGNFLIAGPHQRKNCEKLFGSEREAYVDENTKNVYKDFKFFIHPLLKGKRWFLANETLMKGGSGLNFFMRRDPRSLERDGDAAKGDFNTEILSWKSVGRWDYGATNWHFIVGSNI